MAGNDIAVDDEGILSCPVCQGTYLHHSRVDIFERSEDAKIGLHIHTQGEQVTVNKDLAGNPSLRRHGVAIVFWCESCQGTFVFHIIQHKGQTFLAWEPTLIAYAVNQQPREGL